MPFYGYTPDPSEKQDGSLLPSDQAKYPGQSFIGPVDNPAPAMTPQQELTASVIAAGAAEDAKNPYSIYNFPQGVVSDVTDIGQHVSAGAQKLRNLRTENPVGDAFLNVGAGVVDTLGTILQAPKDITKSVSEYGLGDSQSAVIDAVGGGIKASQIFVPGISVIFNTITQPGTLGGMAVEKAMKFGGDQIGKVQTYLESTPIYGDWYKELNQGQKDEWNQTIVFIATAAITHGVIRGGIKVNDYIKSLSEDIAKTASKQSDPVLQAQYRKDVMEIHPDRYASSLTPDQLSNLNKSFADYGSSYVAGDSAAMAANKLRSLDIINGREPGGKPVVMPAPQKAIKFLDDAQKSLEESKQQSVQDVQGANTEYQKQTAARAGKDLTSVPMEANKAAQIARELAPQDVKVAVVPEIKNGENVSAGVFLPGEKPEIRISERDARKTTAVHEVTHAALSALKTSDPVRYSAVFEAAKRDFGTDDPVRIEERIAEESAYYFEHKTFKSKGLSGAIMDFIRRLYYAVRARVGGTLRKLYHDVATGRFKGEYASTRGRSEAARMQEVVKMGEGGWLKQALDEGAKVEDIKIKDLTNLRKESQPEKVAAFSKLETEAPPIVVIKKGEQYSVLDGNRRIQAAMLNGKDSIKAYVIKGKGAPKEAEPTKEEVAIYAREGGFTKMTPKAKRRAERAAAKQAEAERASKEAAKQEKKQEVAVTQQPEPKPEEGRHEQIKNAAARIAKAISETSRVPGRRAINRAIKEAAPGMFEEAITYAANRGMIRKDKFEELLKNYRKATGRSTMANPSGRGTTSDQKIAIVDMMKWDSVLKGSDERKINLHELDKGLIKSGQVLRLVNPPEGKRMPIPFSLMGNKSATMDAVLRPMFLKGIKAGSEHYVEPYAGAGTVLNAADQMFEAGLKTMNLNHFDREKYLVQKALQDGSITNPSAEVRAAWDVVVKDVSDIIRKIPEIEEIISKSGVQPGTKEFSNLAELSFYPEYAAQFFKETPDSKLAMGGELSEKFKEWLVKKQAEKGMSQSEAEKAADDILSNSHLFEKNYPAISKEISEVLKKYDNVDALTDYKGAILMTMARHMMQRGSSGQRFVSASSGFGSVWNVVKKMEQGFANYKAAFDKHGDKIRLHSMDGKDFIAKMASELPMEKTLAYLDPPYLRTTAVYVKNQPKEIQESLGQYADAAKVAEMFRPLKDAQAILTNDIDGKYIAEMKGVWGDKTAKEVIGYREGTTPTSVISTTGTSIPAKELGLTDYNLLKSARSRDMMKALQESFVPRIAADIKKQVAKLGAAAIEDSAQDRKRIAETIAQLDWSEAAFKKLDEAIKDVASPAERAAVIRDARRILRDTAARGEWAMRILDMVNKHLDEVQALRKDLRNRYDALTSSAKYDARVRAEFEKSFNDRFTTKKLSGTSQEFADLSAKISSGIETPEELERFIKLSEDTGALSEYEGIRSIWQMDKEQLDQLASEITKWEERGSDLKKWEEFNQEGAVKKLAEEASMTAIKSDTPIRSRPPSSLKGWEKIKFLAKRAGINIFDSAGNIAEEMVPSVWLTEQYGLEPYDKALQEAEAASRRKAHVKIKVLTDLAKKNGIDRVGEDRIVMAGTALQTLRDPIVIAKLINTLKYVGDPVTGEKFEGEAALARIREMADVENFLKPAELEWLREYMKETSKEAGPMNEFLARFSDRTFEQKPDYFPTFADLRATRAAGISAGQDFDAEMDRSALGRWRKEGVDKGMTKSRTAMANILDISSGFRNILGHLEDAEYMLNVGPVLKTVSDAAKEIKDKHGSHGYDVLRDIMDTYARHGKLSEAPGASGRIVEKITRNVGTAALSLNPVSYLMQLSSLTDWAGTTGDLTAPVKLTMNFVRPGSKEWKDIHDKSAVLEFRDIGDFMGESLGEKTFGTMLNDLMAGKEVPKNIYDVIKKAGYLPFNVIDQLIGTAGWKVVYNDAITAGMSEDMAIYQADKMVRKTMASPRFNDQSRWILKNKRGWMAPIVQFQTFMVNKAAMMIYGGGKDAKARIEKNLKWAGVSPEKAKWWASRASIVWALATTFLLAAILEFWMREAGNAALGKPENKAPLWQKLLDQAAGYVPVLNQVAGQNKYGGQLWTSWFKNFTKASTAIQSGDTDKAAALSLVGVSQVLGLPTTNVVKYALAGTLASTPSGGGVSLGKVGGTTFKKSSFKKLKKFRMKKVGVKKLRVPRFKRIRKLAKIK